MPWTELMSWCLWKVEQWLTSVEKKKMKADAVKCRIRCSSFFSSHFLHVCDIPSLLKSKFEGIEGALELVVAVIVANSIGRLPSSHKVLHHTRAKKPWLSHVGIVNLNDYRCVILVMGLAAF